jgi:transmembrane sensor
MGMTMTPNDEDIRSAIATQAAEWFLANQSGTLPESERAAFLAWLKTSPVHVREFLGVAGVSRDIERTVVRDPVPLEEFLRLMERDRGSIAAWPRPRDEPRESTQRWAAWRRGFAAAVAVGALLAAGLAWNSRDGQWLGLPRSYGTARGGSASISLPDGSRLQLDTASSVTIRFTGSERIVTLRRGQLFVQVAHDTSRRFRVATEHADAIAVGTRFNVRRHAGRTIVTVADGIVAVSSKDARSENSDTSRQQMLRVTTGRSVTVDRAGAMPPDSRSADLAEALAWLDHRIVFDQRPLGEVVAEFNRYSATPMEVDGAVLASLPISGSFDAGDSESFLKFVETLPGVTVKRTPGRDWISQTRP